VSAIFAVVAKTERGRAGIEGALRRLLPATFPRRARDWWIEPRSGVALHAPIVAGARTGRRGDALAVAGSMMRDGERWTWPAADPATSAAARRASVVLAELARDPATAIARWRGDCAMAYWDGTCSRLVIARDPLGQRGLFVREDEDVHWICSELAPLVSDPGYACRLDFTSAFHYLVTARTPWSRTLADGISRVPPAHLAVWQPGRPWLRQRCYTPLRETATKVADAALRGEVRDALDLAVTSRLTGGRQALLLSGGVDSSYLAARGASLAGGTVFDAYTIEFAAPVLTNETVFARAVAERFGLRHHVVPLGLAETRPLIDRVLAADDPCAAWSTVTHHHLLARIAGDGHTELWSGLGSDEVFGGYKEFLQTYLKWRRFQTRWPLPDAADAFDSVLWHRRDAAAYLFAGNARFLDDASIARGFHPPFQLWRDTSLLEEFYRECRRLKRDAHWFEMAVAHECEHRIPDLLFVNFEPVSRAHGIHTSYPFLDLDVVPLACGLGASDRFQFVARRWLNKKLLREIAGAELPEAIMNRTPTSYSAPIAVWLTTPSLARPMLARMRRSKIWQLGLLRRDWLPRLEVDLARELAAGKAGPECQRVWGLITLAAWYDRWVEGGR
jgi:asparagine synthetase B (glutamine-hydrolysing)